MNTKKHITQREHEVLELISYENTISEIAQVLFLSHHTIMTYRKNLLEKLEVKNTAGMVRRGFELGLLGIGNKPSHKLRSI